MDEEAAVNASDTIWRWRNESLTVAGDSLRMVRIKGFVRSGISFALFALFSYLSWTLMSYIALFLGCLVLFATVFSPQGILAALNRGTDRLGVWIGAAVTWLFLPIIYYLVITPLGIAIRGGSRNTIKQQVPTDETSYFTPRDPGLLSAGTREKLY